MLKRSREDIVLDLFSECGIEDIDYSNGIYETDDFYIRVLCDEEIVQFAGKENFDRWSTAVDYEHEGIPYDEDDVKQMLDLAKQAIEETKNQE